MAEIICLDVGGDRYNVRRGCLTRLPNTRLGRLARKEISCKIVLKASARPADSIRRASEAKDI